MYLISLVKIPLYSLTAYKTSINHPTSLPPAFPPSLRQHQLTTWNKKRRLSSPPAAHALATLSTQIQLTKNQFTNPSAAQKIQQISVK